MCRHQIQGGKQDYFFNNSWNVALYIAGLLKTTENFLYFSRIIKKYVLNVLVLVYKKNISYISQSSSFVP